MGRLFVEQSVESMGKAMDSRKIHADMERIATDFRDLTESATPDELPARTNGTRWTNRQMLFHMLFGFLVARALLSLVKGFGRLPAATSRVFATVLNAATRPFHVLNYLSALPGSKVLRVTTMASLMDSTIAHLRGRLEREVEHTLVRTMHFPTGWDPYFKDVMTVADVYAYPIQHYDHHRRQLTTRHALGS